MRLTFPFERIRTTLVSFGGVSLEDHPARAEISEIKFRCPTGIDVETSAFKLLYKQACPHCQPRDEISLTLLNRIADLHNGRCLATTYDGYNVPHPWQCDCDFIWNTTPRNILQGRWCPRCATFAKTKKLSDVQDYAKSIEMKCTSPIYVNNHTEMSWECLKSGKTSNETFNSLAKRGSCRCCSN